MDSEKSINSKINQLKGRLDTIKNSGHFSEEEIKKLSLPINKQLEQIQV